MAASSGDKFKKLTNNFTTTLSGAIVGAGDSSMSLASTTNLPTDTGTVFVIDRVNSSGTATPSLREYVKGTVVGSNVTNLVRGLGGSTAQAHSTGAVVEQVVDQNTINDLMDGILTQHNQDGTHGAVTATSVSAPTVAGTTSVSEAGTTLQTIRSEQIFDFVASGCVWTADAAGSTRNASMTSGVVYIGGKRVAVSSVTARSFTASKDTYIDVDNTGTITYTEVTNNAASPALSANNVRLGIIVTGASNIAAAGSINQGQETAVLPIVSSVPYCTTDSLGNLICPRDPGRKVLGYRQISGSNITVTSGSAAAFSTDLICPVNIPANRKVKVSLGGEYVATSAATGNGFFLVTNDVTAATNIGTLTLTSPGAGYSCNPNTSKENYTPPASGFRTFKPLGSSAAGGTVTWAGTNQPLFIKVELA